MKCDWEFTDQPCDQPGWRYVRCTRSGCGIKGGPTNHELDSIVSSGCQGWPRWWEFGNCVAFALEVVGLSKRRWTWLMLNLNLVEPAAGCSGCEAREKWLNSAGGKTVMLWRRLLNIYELILPRWMRRR